MTTPIQQKIRDKKRTPEQIAEMVKSGDWINNGSVGGDSTVCTEAVARRLGPGPGSLKDIEFWLYACFTRTRSCSRSIPYSSTIASMSSFSFPGTAKPVTPTM